MFANDTVYQTYIPQKISYLHSTGGDGNTAHTQVQYLPNINSLTGFSTLYSPSFAKGVR